MKKIFTIQLFLFLLSACEKSALTDASDSVSRPVVEAYLLPGQTPAVKITHQIPYNADSTVAAQPIDNLDVSVESDGVIHLFAFTGDTIYTADGAWQPETGKTYRLSFHYNGGAVTAETVVPAKPVNFSASASTLEIPSFEFGSGTFPTFPDPVELTWDNPDGAYYLVVVENIETDPDPVYEDDGSMNRPRPIFRSQPEQNNLYEIGFQNFQYFGTHLLILYRLNPEYAALYEDNGNSSQNLTTPYTNVNGGLGIFSGMNADTLLLEVKEQ